MEAAQGAASPTTQGRAQRLSLLPAASSAPNRHCTRHASRAALSNQGISMCAGSPITAVCRQQRHTPQEAAFPTPLPPWRGGGHRQGYLGVSSRREGA